MRDFLIGLVLVGLMIGFASWVPEHVQPVPAGQDSGILDSLQPG